MTYSITVTEDDIFTAVRAFLLDALGGGVEVIQGQANRVAEPAASSYVVMTPLRRSRLSTNIENWDGHSLPAPSTLDLVQPTMFDVQIDVHGAAASDLCQIIATVWRSSTAVEFFRTANQAIVPLYCDDGRQMPFVNGESQYETRWLITASLQANPVVSTAQQFAATLTITPVSVDAAFPPGA